MGKANQGKKGKGNTSKGKPINKWEGKGKKEATVNVAATPLKTNSVNLEIPPSKPAEQTKKLTI